MIKIYLDEDVHQKAAYSLRAKGFDVLSTVEADNRGLSDEEQLEFAVSQKKTIFTFNIRDFIRLHKKYLEEGKEHYGIIISSQISISELIMRLSLKFMSIKPEDIYNQLFWLYQSILAGVVVNFARGGGESEKTPNKRSIKSE